MRKIFILSFIFLGIKINAQEKLYDVLKKLDVNKTKIDFSSTKGIDFRESEQLGNNDLLNFLNNESKLEFTFMKINKIGNYYMFAIVPKKELVSIIDDSILYFNSILLYDQIKNKMFLLDYGFDGFPLIKINKNSFEISTNLTKNVSRFTELKNDFHPLYSINIEFLRGYYVYSIDFYITISDVNYVLSEKKDNQSISFEDLIYNDISRCLIDKMKLTSKKYNTKLFIFN
ncbi:hypothetical protein FLAVO9AF_910007 [Flavobacterium sp. 9AF]|uniref:hypothetical protein n=1 Tax=Flavobacterium sp. 9AF TaxID=2653142 RepID=UPI0012EFD442|nr:hypothetical protein [Flavobacterium sp. 9AF]VXC38444.1 hypothetical protein FLAVO9AF_910007 [Flavobacterium sp. 9AF]